MARPLGRCRVSNKHSQSQHDFQGFSVTYLFSDGIVNDETQVQDDPQVRANPIILYFLLKMREQRLAHIDVHSSRMVVASIVP